MAGDGRGELLEQVGAIPRLLELADGGNDDIVVYALGVDPDGRRVRGGAGRRRRGRRRVGSKARARQGGLGRGGGRGGVVVRPALVSWTAAARARRRRRRCRGAGGGRVWRSWGACAGAGRSCRAGAGAGMGAGDGLRAAERGCPAGLCLTPAARAVCHGRGGEGEEIKRERE